MIIDISLELSNNTIVWPGDPKINIEKKVSIQDGAVCNVSSIEMGVHSATHIDAPYHFIDDAETIESISLDILVGTCYVVEIDDIDSIKKENLNSIDFNKYKRILFKTKNSSYYKKREFNKEFVHIDIDTAKYLAEKGVKLIGIDYLSIEGFYSDGSVHKEILKNKIVALEGIDLSMVQAGEYELICLPLKLIGTDGAPARAILRK
jgi:arylformamidase